jgi:2OG-Fe(II) oxygenase superfamily
MGKAGKSRKRARRAVALGSTEGAITAAPPTATPEWDLAAGDVAITERTLQWLLEAPETRLRSPAARTMRRQAYAMVAVLGQTTTAGRIGEALHEHRWSEAKEALAQLQEPPALGAMQRWIRDLFEPAAAATADPVTISNLLYRILICAGQTAYGDDTGEEDGIPGPIKVLPLWYSIPRREPDDAPSDDSAWVVPEVRVVAIESAWREGMTVWTTTADATTLLDSNDNNATTDRPPPCRVPVPFVPGGFILHHILSPLECHRIIQVAQAMGFTPEASYSLSSSSSSSGATGSAAAADGVVWIAAAPLHEALWQRVAALLPPHLAPAQALVHLNRRWRIYRYTTGTVYRPHLDGAWTGSGIDDQGRYQKDLYSGKVLSRLTFLMYLNDNFESGGTTFYAPAREAGCIAARSIAPRQGSVLCFPHGPGVAQVGLVHEGSAVTKGTKYVLRTDVLYEKSGRRG